MKNRRRWIIATLVALFLAGALLGGRASTGERGPSGMLAMRRTLVGLGIDVRDADEPPLPPATFVLTTDFRGQDEAARIQQWVEAGGKLVLTDADSILAGMFGIAASGIVGSLGAANLPPGCATPATAGVRRITVTGNAPLLEPETPGGITCFTTGRGSFLVTLRAGDGEVVVLGSASPFTNEFFGRADNAVLAVNLFGTRGPVVFGPPVPTGAQMRGGGLWATLPPAGKVIAAQIALALVAFALVRGRRLGHAVPEAPRAPIPAGELVRATGRLLRSARATQHASTLLRDHLARRVAARQGFGSSETAIKHARELSQTAGDALEGPDAANDAELIELGKKLEDVRKELEGADR